MFSEGDCILCVDDGRIRGKKCWWLPWSAPRPLDQTIADVSPETYLAFNLVLLVHRYLIHQGLHGFLAGELM
jgi:hypothetical protein